MLLHGLDILARRKTEIPSLRVLTNLIIGEIKQHKWTLTQVINALLSPKLHNRLDGLLSKPESEADSPPKIQRFLLTLLTKISQS